MSLTEQATALPWPVVEKAIFNEIEWLRLLIVSFGHHASCKHCDGCAYRHSDFTWP